MFKRKFAISAALLLAAASRHMLAERAWRVTGAIALPGDDAVTLVAQDVQLHRIFIARTSGVTAVDILSGKELGRVPVSAGVRSVALAPRVGRGFLATGDGGVLVFDLKTLAVLGNVPIQNGADEVSFDRTSGLLVVLSRGGHSLVTFPAATELADQSSARPLPLEGTPAGLATDGDGHAYVVLMDRDAVAVIDLKANSIQARWTVPTAGPGAALAGDPAHHRLYVATGTPGRVFAVNTVKGTVQGRLPAGAPECVVALDRGETFTACADGTVSILRDISPGGWQVAQVLQTASRSGQMAIDHGTHRLYLPVYVDGWQLLVVERTKAPGR